MTALSEQGKDIPVLSEAEIKAAEAKSEAQKKTDIETYRDFFKHALSYTLFDAGNQETIDLHPYRHRAKGEIRDKIVKIDDVESIMVEVTTKTDSPQAPSVPKPLSKLRRTASAVGLALLGEF